ncbi:MAG: magnesium transporter CorA family protein [Patescibacteria group bacterium]|mgnify:CR=1 FL=1
MKHFHEIQQNGLLWVSVTKQGEKELEQLGRRFNFQKVDLNECLPPFQRPKMVKRPGYYFLVLHFPIFDRGSRRVRFTEIDIFLNPNFLVTVHDGQLPTIRQFFEECSARTDVRAQYFSGTMAQSFFELLSRLLDSVMPSLLHINEDINSVDQSLFTETSDRQMAGEILRLKTNIVTFRRTMQGHRSVLERLLASADKDLMLGAYQANFNALRETETEIWHTLESQKESIYALHETNESVLSYRSNEVMKFFTIISVITSPLILLAGLFAVRAPNTPFIDSPQGFWVIFGFFIFVTILMIVVFRRKKWL